MPPNAIVSKSGRLIGIALLSVMAASSSAILAQQVMKGDLRGAHGPHVKIVHAIDARQHHG